MQTTDARIPPSTGKKKKARRVFGEVADDDHDISLTYSPSPNISRDDSNDSELPTFNEQNSENSNSSNQENTKNVRFLNTATNPTKHTIGQERVLKTGTFSRSPVRPDLVKKTQDAINKANLSMKNFSQAISVARQAKADFYNYKKKEVLKIRNNWKADNSEAKSLSELTEQNRRNFLYLQRQFSSKYSKEKARRERANRLGNLNHIDQETEFNSSVFRDHKLVLKQEEDNRRRHSVAVRAKIRTNNRLGGEKLKLEKIQEDQAIFDERHAASTALRDAIQRNSTQRRQSFAFRNGDARRIRTLHATLEDQRHQQEHKSFELKWQAENDANLHISKKLQARRESLATRNAKCRDLRKAESEIQQSMLSAEHKSYELKWEAEKDAFNYVRKQGVERRKSLMRRNIEGKRQRDYIQHQNVEAASHAHADFELKWAGENDANAYRSKLEQDRRESLAFRNAEGRRQRNVSQHEQCDLANKAHESYELKWDGEIDAVAYNAKMAAERRDSMAKRNLDARRQRSFIQHHKVEVSCREHECYELNRAAFKDTEEYLLEQEKLRRESLQDRNKERVQHAKVLEELRMLTLERESESFVLKWAGENDAKIYLAKLEEERRLSLQLRGLQTRHNLKIQSETISKQLMELHETEALHAIDHQEKEAYIKHCTERDRASFEYRRKDARIQRIQEAETSRELREKENQNQKLETLARIDVVDYVEDCKKRRRMSLAYRAKEKRMQAEWLRKKNDRQIEEQLRRGHDQQLDQKYVEHAKQKERARLALNAIRHVAYTFHTNATAVKIPKGILRG